MRSIRVLAILTLALVAAFYILRAVAVRCAGPECEVYIPFSLLLPIAALILAAVTGALAILAASQRRQAIWLGLLGVCTLVSVLGPIASAFIYRDNPDLFVPVATALILLTPLGALIYTFAGDTRA
jgi:hypothetical protein